MAKFKKILSIIVLAVFSMTFLVGCSLFVLNEDRYREQQVMTVGSEVVMLGEVIDFFNANAYSYIQGGSDVQSLWDSLFPYFIQQKMLISEYKAAFNSSNKNTSELAKKYKNGEYLTDEELNYIRMSIFVSTYKSLDTQTKQNLASDFNFDTTDDGTSDERQDLIKRPEQWSPSKEDAYLDFESMKKTLAKYNEQDYEKMNYVFASGDENLAKKVEELNGILKKSNDEDPDVTEEDYIKAQNTAVRTFTNNVKNNRNMTVEEYFVYAIEEQIFTQISSKYLNGIYKDKCEDYITEEDFNLRLANLRAQAKTTYDQNPLSFASFITGLAEGSFVYYVPEMYKGEYHYVRSILLPFSDEQTDKLSNAKNLLGADTDAYVQFRADLAKNIKVKDFTDDENGAETDIDVNALLGSNASFNGVALSGVNKETFINWTYAYNTDPGMFNPERGYVISKSSSNMTGTDEKFVKEFVAGARDLANNPSKNSVAVITDYGIHILLYDGEVVADDISWADRFNYGLEKGSVSYRFFAAMYSDVKNMVANDVLEDLYQQYKDGNDGKVFNIDNGVLKGYTDQLGITLS